MNHRSAKNLSFVRTTHFSMTATKAFDEIAAFIASVSPEKVIAFRPAPATQQRVEALIFKEKNAHLTAEEKAELDDYMTLEHLMRMAKARAHLLLKAA